VTASKKGIEFIEKSKKSLESWLMRGTGLPSFPDYELPHLSLVQSHEPKIFNHFKISLSIITNHLSKCHSSFLFVIIVLLLLLSLSLFALVSYFLLLIIVIQLFGYS